MRAGNNGDRSLDRSPCGVVGNIAACEPTELLVGRGSASNARTVQIGKTSINNIRLSSPLGWKKDTAVDGIPKPIRYDQCDSLKRKRCVSHATYFLKRPSSHSPYLLETKVAVDHGHDKKGKHRSSPWDV